MQKNNQIGFIVGDTTASELSFFLIKGINDYIDNGGKEDFTLFVENSSANIIDPNFDVPEGYRMVTITSRDGRVYAGNVTEEDNTKVVLTMVGQTSVISKADIKTRLVSKISLMPEGLLLTLNDKEFLDLIKYLRTEKQVELPKQ